MTNAKACQRLARAPARGRRFPSPELRHGRTPRSTPTPYTRTTGLSVIAELRSKATGIGHSDNAISECDALRQTVAALLG